MTLIRKRVIWPKVPNQVRCAVDCSIAVVLARATAEGTVVSMPPARVLKLSRADVAVSDSDIAECRRSLAEVPSISANSSCHRFHLSIGCPRPSSPSTCVEI